MSEEQLKNDGCGSDSKIHWAFFYILLIIAGIVMLVKGIGGGN